MSLDLLTMSLHIATQEKSRLGIFTHQLSLIGISRLAVENRLGLPMTIAEIRDFGVLVHDDNHVVVTFEVSDQVDFDIACNPAVFDGIALDASRDSV